MRLLECIEGPFCEDPVRTVHTRQGHSRGLFVIEQRVVEIEEHGPGDMSRSHTFIIETTGRDCMVN